MRSASAGARRYNPQFVEEHYVTTLGAKQPLHPIYFYTYVGSSRVTCLCRVPDYVALLAELIVFIKFCLQLGRHNLADILCSKRQLPASVQTSNAENPSKFVFPFRKPTDEGDSFGAKTNLYHAE